MLLLYLLKTLVLRLLALCIQLNQVCPELLIKYFIVSNKKFYIWNYYEYDLNCMHGSAQWTGHVTQIVLLNLILWHEPQRRRQHVTHVWRHYLHQLRCTVCGIKIRVILCPTHVKYSKLCKKYTFYLPERVIL